MCIIVLSVNAFVRHVYSSLCVCVYMSSLLLEILLPYCEFWSLACRISLKHPSLFGRSEKLDVILDKGINDSNVVVAFRRPRPEWLSQQSFVIQVGIVFNLYRLSF